MGKRQAARGALRRCTAAGVLIASILATVPAPAQSSAGNATINPDQATQAAKLYYDEGVRLAIAGQWEESRELLLASFQLDPSPTTAANLGRVELKTGRYRDAFDHLSFFLREARQISDGDRKATEAMIAEAKAKLGAVTIHVDIPGAEVLVDGQPVGSSPLAEPVFVDAGSRRFEARKPGHGAVHRVSNIAPGTAPDVELKLSSPPVIQPAAATPKDAGKKETRQILIYTGSAVSGGLALTGILTAIGAAATKQTSLNEWKENKCTQANSQCKKDWNTAEERRVLLGNTAGWTLIGAAVVGGATAAGAFLMKPHLTTAPKTAVLVTPQGGVIMVTGSF